jgi:hypothetical protein
MRNKILFYIAFAIIIILPLSSASMFVIGKVNGAKDGTSANGREIVLWNSKVGIRENITDIIGVEGNSGTSNSYMFDCEQLESPCQIGDTLYMQVIPSKDKYQTERVSVTIGAGGFVKASDLTLVRSMKHVKRNKIVLIDLLKSLRR